MTYNLLSCGVARPDLAVRFASEPSRKLPSGTQLEQAGSPHEAGSVPNVRRRSRSAFRILPASSNNVSQFRRLGTSRSVFQRLAATDISCQRPVRHPRRFNQLRTIENYGQLLRTHEIPKAAALTPSRPPREHTASLAISHWRSLTSDVSLAIVSTDNGDR